MTDSHKQLIARVKETVPDSIVRSEVKEHFYRRWRSISQQANQISENQLESFCSQIETHFGGWCVRVFFAFLWLSAIPAIIIGLVGEYATGSLMRLVIGFALSSGLLAVTVKMFLHCETLFWDYVHGFKDKPNTDAATVAVYRLSKAGLLYDYFHYCVNKEANKNNAA